MDSSPSNLALPARTPVGLFLLAGLWYDDNKAFPGGGSLYMEDKKS